MTAHNHIRSRSLGLRNTLAPALIAAISVGCGGPAPETNPTPSPSAKAPSASAPSPAATTAAPDPDDVPIKQADVAKPKDYVEALSRIEGYRNTIRDEIAAGRPTKAHRGLDELDIVLDWLPAIARDSGVPKEQWEKVNTTAKAIQDLFNQVHSRIDDKKEPDYGSVSAAIDTAIGDLKKITAAAKTAEPEKKP